MIDINDVIYTRAHAGHAPRIHEIERLCFPAPWSLESFIKELSDDLARYFIACLQPQSPPTQPAQPPSPLKPPPSPLQLPQLQPQPAQQLQQLSPPSPLQASQLTQPALPPPDGCGQAVIIGYCGYWSVVGEAHITNVAVHPGYRGRGVGRGLLRAMLADAVTLGHSSATLEARDDNYAAIRLYEQFGFTRAGLRKKYYQPENKDAVIMWKRFI